MGVTLTKEMIDGAKHTEEQYGIPSSVTLAQIMLESGGSYEGGLSGLAYNYNNLFGVTAGSSWTGETVVMSNKAGTDTKTYRVYDNIEDSIVDHARVLLNSRYTQYTGNAQTVSEYVDGVAKGGYAEDPNYASKLKSMISKYNLTAYDGNSWQGKSGKLSTSDVESVTSSTHNSTLSTSETSDLKWWGDIVVVVLAVLLIGLAIVFFISAFNGVKAPTSFNVGKNLTKKVVNKVSDMKKGDDSSAEKSV